jgi:hypothetical protein
MFFPFSRDTRPFVERLGKHLTTVIYMIAAGSHYEEKSENIYRKSARQSLMSLFLSYVYFYFYFNIYFTGMRNIMDTMEGRRKQGSPTILIW